MQTERFDIALLDAQAGVDIVEVAAAIRIVERGRRAAIIAVTEDAAESSREPFRASGVNGWIARQIQPGELFEMNLKPVIIPCIRDRS